jgi:hypothetical protein
MIFRQTKRRPYCLRFIRSTVPANRQPYCSRPIRYPSRPDRKHEFYQLMSCPRDRRLVEFVQLCGGNYMQLSSYCTVLLQFPSVVA